MKKFTFGSPEKIVPTNFCKGLSYKETDIKYNITKMKFKETQRGCVLEFPLDKDEQIYGFGLQLKGFNHKNVTKMSRPARILSETGMYPETP